MQRCTEINTPTPKFTASLVNIRHLCYLFGNEYLIAILKPTAELLYKADDRQKFLQSECSPLEQQLSLYLDKLSVNDLIKVYRAITDRTIDCSLLSLLGRNINRHHLIVKKLLNYPDLAWKVLASMPWLFDGCTQEQQTYLLAIPITLDNFRYSWLFAMQKEHHLPAICNKIFILLFNNANRLIEFSEAEYELLSAVLNSLKEYCKHFLLPTFYQCKKELHRYIPKKGEFNQEQYEQAVDECLRAQAKMEFLKELDLTGSHLHYPEDKYELNDYILFRFFKSRGLKDIYNLLAIVQIFADEEDLQSVLLKCLRHASYKPLVRSIIAYLNSINKDWLFDVEVENYSDVLWFEQFVKCHHKANAGEVMVQWFFAKPRPFSLLKIIEWRGNILTNYLLHYCYEGKNRDFTWIKKIIAFLNQHDKSWLGSWMKTLSYRDYYLVFLNVCRDSNLIYQNYFLPTHSIFRQVTQALDLQQRYYDNLSKRGSNYFGQRTIYSTIIEVISNLLQQLPLVFSIDHKQDIDDLVTAIKTNYDQYFGEIKDLLSEKIELLENILAYVVADELAAYQKKGNNCSELDSSIKNYGTFTKNLGSRTYEQRYIFYAKIIRTLLVRFPKYPLVVFLNYLFADKIKTLFPNEIVRLFASITYGLEPSIKERLLDAFYQIHGLFDNYRLTCLFLRNLTYEACESLITTPAFIQQIYLKSTESMRLVLSQLTLEQQFILITQMPVFAHVPYLREMGFYDAYQELKKEARILIENNQEPAAIKAAQELIRDIEYTLINDAEQPNRHELIIKGTQVINDAKKHLNYYPVIIQILDKLLSILASIFTLGAANYFTGRGLYSLFNWKPEIVKRSEQLEQILIRSKSL